MILRRVIEILNVEVLNFLEIKDDGRNEFPRVNDSKKAKSNFY